MLARGDFRRLGFLVKLHTEFRSRINDHPPPIQGAPASSFGLFAGPEELIAEEAWPSDLPLVSVVITCFNYGKFVADAVASVLAQTFSDLEVIVVEGGSTDSTSRDVVAALKHPRMRVLFRGEPRKTGDNRNFGIAEARGKYVCCLDADDMLRPTYLEKALFLLEHYGYDVVSTSGRKFGLANDLFHIMPSPCLADMADSNQVATCAVFRRVLWEQVGGYRDAISGQPYVFEDWRFWMRVAATGARICNITGEQLFLYRIHNLGSLTSTPGLIPRDTQGALIRAANSDVLTREAFKNSKRRARKRLRSADALRNLRRTPQANPAGLTVLLAVPFLIMGGAERILNEVVGHLARGGHRVIIVSTLPFGPEFGDSSAAFEAITPEIYHLPRFLIPDRWQHFVDYLIEAKQVDVLWIVNSAFFHNALPYLKGRYPYLRVADQQFNTIAHSANNRKFAAHIDITIAENGEVGAWLTDHGETPERIAVIPSGVDLKSFSPSVSGQAARATLKFPPGSFVVGFSGRLAEEKAPLSFLRIAASIPAELPIRFVMTGTGPLERQVRHEIERLKLEDRVRFQGVVADVRDYLACYDILVLPSVIDGRPVVVMEALAMGLPVIASCIGGLPELIVEGKTGFLCDAHDLASFASRIRQSQADPEAHARMRRAARAFAEQHLDVETMRTRYEEALVSIADRGATRKGVRRDLMDVA